MLYPPRLVRSLRSDYVKELRKPLKAPPPGLEWRRLNDGTWELRRSVRQGPDSVALAAAEASGCVEAAGTVGSVPGEADGVVEVIHVFVSRAAAVMTWCP